MLEREPHKSNIRIRFFQCCLTIADLADEYSIAGQKSRCIMQDQFHRIQTVIARRQSELGLVPKLLWQNIHILAIDVRRIADDQVVGSRVKLVEKTGLDKPYSMTNIVLANVDPRDIQCLARNIDSVHRGVRERFRQRDCYATAASAQISDRGHRARRQPGFESIVNQFRDRRTWNQHAFINIERQSREPGFVDQVRDRHVLADTSLGERLDLAAPFRVDRLRIRRRRIVVRQAEVREYEPGSLVYRAVGAVAIAEISLDEAIRYVPYQLLDRHFLLFPTAFSRMPFDVGEI